MPSSCLCVQGVGTALGCRRAHVDESGLGELPLLRGSLEDIRRQGESVEIETVSIS